MLVTCPQCGAAEHRREAELADRPVFCCAMCGSFWRQSTWGLPEALAELPPGVTPEMIARDQLPTPALPAGPEVLEPWMDRPDKPMTAASPARESDPAVELEPLVASPPASRRALPEALPAETPPPRAARARPPAPELEPADEDVDISWSVPADPAPPPRGEPPPPVSGAPAAFTPAAPDPVSAARLFQAGVILALGTGLVGWVIAAKAVFWPLGLTTLALFIVTYQTLIRNQMDSGPGPALRFALQATVSLVVAYAVRRGALPSGLEMLAPIQGYVALLFLALAVLWGIAALWAARTVRPVFNWRLPLLLAGLMLGQYVLHAVGLMVPASAGLLALVAAIGSLIGGAVGFGWASEPGATIRPRGFRAMRHA